MIGDRTFDFNNQFSVTFIMQQLGSANLYYHILSKEVKLKIGQLQLKDFLQTKIDSRRVYHKTQNPNFVYNTYVSTFKEQFKSQWMIIKVGSPHNIYTILNLSSNHNVWTISYKKFDQYVNQSDILLQRISSKTNILYLKYMSSPPKKTTYDYKNAKLNKSLLILNLYSKIGDEVTYHGYAAKIESKIINKDKILFNIAYDDGGNDYVLFIKKQTVETETNPCIFIGLLILIFSFV